MGRTRGIRHPKKGHIDENLPRGSETRIGEVVRGGIEIMRYGRMKGGGLLQMALDCRPFCVVSPLEKAVTHPPIAMAMAMENSYGFTWS